MREKKRRMETFSVHDRSGMERHLVQMAEKGWLLEKIGQFCWTYRRIEPQALTFCVCYFPKASQFDPGPSEEQRTFYDFCAHTGWTLAAANAQLQIFYNERPAPVPIETDPVTELDAIHRTMKRSFLPSQLVLLALGLLNGGMLVYRLLNDPIGVLSSAGYLVSGLCWTLLLLLIGIEVTGYLLWHRKAAQAAERGEFLESKSHRGFQIFCLILVLLGVGYYLGTIFLSGDQQNIAITIAMLCCYGPGLFFLVIGIKGLMKREKAPAKVNRVVTLVGSCVIGMMLIGLITGGIMGAAARGWFAGERETYEYYGETLVLYQDELPLTIEDLLDVDYDGYIRERRQEDETFLLARLVMRESPRYDAEHYKDIPQLSYNIVLVKLPALYSLCRDTLLNQWPDDWYWDYSYVPTDAAPWGAQEAYRQTEAEHGLLNRYLLCYPDRIVEITFSSDSDSFDWNVTPEQMALVGERLGRGPL